jgi:hypothetical protein
MRPGVLAGLVFFSASAACAQPAAVLDNLRSPGIMLPSADDFAAGYAKAQKPADFPPLTDDSSRLQYIPSSSEFGIGPLRADTAKSVGTGRRASVKPGFRLEGVRVFGGSISGSLDGRGGMLALHWGGNN